MYTNNIDILFNIYIYIYIYIYTVNSRYIILSIPPLLLGIFTNASLGL